MSEVRALLLTDVVDSTKLSEALGDVRMAQLWASHDRVARDLLPLHRGREIDKTDGFLLLFEQAADAVAYAVAYHAAVGALEPPIQARAGLHVGPVILTENSAADVALGAKPLEVDGLAKPTAARVMGLARGGQTLLTHDALRALGAPELRVQSHGHWRMKGVSEPTELFEIGTEDAPFVPPPDGGKVYRVVRDGELWLPLAAVPHSLPRERDAFVGRTADLLELAHVLNDGASLVSVLGMGGTGKTRLVTRYGWTWLGDYPGGVWFCDLSEARTAEELTLAVARGLEIKLEPGDPTAHVGRVIAGRERCLVILDNFEQVARHAADTLGHWLDGAPLSKFIATTREILGLPGEWALALRPLDPEAAVALFGARGAASKRGFAITADNREDVLRLVELLDCLPLAIELAAARVRTMPPATLVARMDQRFRLLTSSGGRRDRQATLRATLDWSWELLSPGEQEALAQLSVFEGGFTLEAAEEVLDLEATEDAPWPADAVQALVDKSLVREVGDGRFDLLVSVQEYAAQQLEARGGTERAQIAHGARFAQAGDDDALLGLTSHGGLERMQALRRDSHNLTAACRRACDRDDADIASRTLVAWLEGMRDAGQTQAAVELSARVRGLPSATETDRRRADVTEGEHWSRVGQPRQSISPLRRAMQSARVAGDIRIQLRAASQLIYMLPMVGAAEEARDLGVEAIEIARVQGHRAAEGELLHNLGIVEAHLGPCEVERFAEALAIHREVGNQRSEPISLMMLAVAHRGAGRTDEAMATLEAAIALSEQTGTASNAVHARLNLAGIQMSLGQLEPAAAQCERAIAQARVDGQRVVHTFALYERGRIWRLQGELAESLRCLQEALAIAEASGDQRSTLMLKTELAATLAHAERVDEAIAMLRSCLDLDRDGLERELAATHGHLSTLLATRGALAEARQHNAMARGLFERSAEWGGVLQVSYERAALECDAGDAEAARAALAQADALMAERGIQPDVDTLAVQERVRTALERVGDQLGQISRRGL